MATSRAIPALREPRVFHVEPRHIDVERLLINLYILLKYDGRRLLERLGRRGGPLTLELLARRLGEAEGTYGFAEHPEMTKQWLASDIVNIHNRDRTGEAVATLRPFHLNSYKLRNARYSRDFNASEQVYSMLENGDHPDLMRRLRAYLSRGINPQKDRYDGKTDLDLYTTVVLRLTDSETDQPSTDHRSNIFPPLCKGQARLLSNDLDRLLAYEPVIPRQVLIEWMQILVGLHLGLNLLRLFRMLPEYVARRQIHPECTRCPIDVGSRRPFADCPYRFGLVTDVGHDAGSTMAEMARADWQAEEGRIQGYIHGVTMVSALVTYATQVARRHLGDEPISVAQALSYWAGDEAELDGYARAKTETLLENLSRQEQEQEVNSLLQLGLSPFEQYVALSVDLVHRHRHPYFRDCLDSLLQKNRPSGLLRQGKGRSRMGIRRFHFGSRLLEVLVQLAVLEPMPATGGYRTRPLLVHDFTHWLYERYGIDVGGPASRGESTHGVSIMRAWRENAVQLSERLREIGVWTDVSDAYNAQAIRTRHQLHQSPRQGGEDS